MENYYDSFFFSSRRRHTRWPRDWSSDVCSSDLAALADLLASGYNRYTGKVTPAPAFVALEASVLRWLCDLFEMPESSQALLTTGGSLANMTALAAARTKYADGRTGKAVVYVGEHGHGSLAKAARTIGVSRHHIRMIPSRPDLRIDLDRLRELVAADRAAGLIPIAVCAAAGTTNTGTIDLLPELADLATELEVWLHVDAAYGGFFQLTERGKKRLNGIERADSITLDPHKSLFLPDRKSTRLNSSHVAISYAVFCLKKKKACT